MIGTEEIKKNKIKIIAVIIVLFVIGYGIGTFFGYVAWKGYVDETVDFLSDLQILGKGNYDVNEVRNQIQRIYEVHQNENYFQTVEELNKLQEIYPNLQHKKEFQRLIKKIQ